MFVTVLIFQVPASRLASPSGRSPVSTGSSNSLLPASAFYFAEGTCRPNFDTYFCIQNPGGSDARVDITYMKGDGTTDTDQVTVAPGSRSTVSPRAKLGTGDDPAHDFSATVECTNGQQIVAERPVYFDYHGWTGGHDVMGATSVSPWRLKLPPAGSIYHGVYPGGHIDEDDITPADVRSYEKSAGKHAAWVYFSNSWYRTRSFPVETATWIRERGSVPFIRLILMSGPERPKPEPEFTLDRIIRGEFDSDFKAWARSARDFATPLIVEYGTEVNGEWFPWNGKWNGGGATTGYGDPNEPDGPERFRDAYRHIIELMRSAGAGNITWVFHANGDDQPGESWNSLENYYPGNQWIDWIGVSAYGPQTPLDEYSDTFRSMMDSAYPRLASLSSSKPIFVLEFGVTSGNPYVDQAEWAGSALRDLTSLRWPRVAGFSWWNEKWPNDDDPAHNTDMRVQDNPDLSDAFKRLVGAKDTVLGRPIILGFNRRPVYSDPAPGSVQNPAFSPDGTRVLFTVFHEGYNEGPAGLFTVPAAGGVPEALIDREDHDCVNLPGSCWNAQSRRIAFSSDLEGPDDIWTIGQDGGSLRQVTTHTGGYYFVEPSFSPDGKWLVFERDVGDTEEDQEGSIWKVRADGTGLTRLTHGEDDRQPNWSPAGNRILFQRRKVGSDNWDIYTIAPDGKKLSRVTFSPSSDTDASWSPDGKWIVYSSDYGGIQMPSIFMIPASGSEPTRVTWNDTHEDGAPSWSPDGNSIAFESHLGADETTPANIWLIAVPPH